jgi:hypothetical protein
VPPKGTANLDSDDFDSDSENDSESSDSDEDAEEVDEFNWQLGKALKTPQLGPTRQSSPKNLPPGAIQLPAVSIFQLLVPVQTIAVITQETNRYAQQCQTAESKWSPNSTQYPLQKFQPLSASECYSFLGVCVAMSLGPKGNYKTFWSTTCRGGYVPTQMGRIMTRKRFEELKRYLHFTDNEVLVPAGSPGYQKLGKLGVIPAQLNANARKYQAVGSWNNVDEGTVASHHRSHLRQFMKSKPDKYSIKLWCFNDSFTGYFYYAEPYGGKRPGERPTKNLTVAVVLEAVDAVKPPIGSIVATDRFFTSPALSLELLERGYNHVGTVMPNRKNFPADLLEIPKKSPRGTIRHATTENGELMALCWFDNKPVYMLTTKYTPGDAQVERKTYDPLKTNFRKVSVPCSTVVTSYNDIMGGTDLGDKSRNLRSLEKTVGTKKWYVRLFFGLIGMAIHNAFVIFKQLHPKIKKLEFLTDLQEQLIQLHMPVIPMPKFKTTAPSPEALVLIGSPPGSGALVDRAHGRGTGTNGTQLVMQPLALTHTKQQYPLKNTHDGNKRYRKQRKCALHTELGKRKETSWYCVECHVGLCLLCWDDYDHARNPARALRRKSPKKKRPTKI